jgi:acetyl-CoA acetyltransferase
VFSEAGTITAGNSSGITDGAAAVVVANEHFVKQHNLKPLSRILAVASAGVDPRTMGIGPVPALRKLEDKHNLRLHEFGLIELNEAFAAQVLACDRTLNFNRDRLNVNGGAIAASHWVHGDADHCNAAARDAEAQYQARRGHVVRERRHGDGAGAGKCSVSSRRASLDRTAGGGCPHTNS